MLCLLSLSLATEPEATDAARTLAVPRTADAIRVDGVIDEGAWAGAAIAPAFRTFQPNGDAVDTEVEARVIQDDRALYFAFTVRTERPLDSALLPRDETTFQDWVGVSLDTFRDARRAYTFRANPRGVQADGVYVEGLDFWFLDLSWDDVWDSAGVLTKDGYTVEIAIPFRTLRYGPEAEQTWGIVLTHFVPTPWTVNTWPTLSRDESAILPQAAALLVHPPKPRGLRLELNPTLTGAWAGPGSPVVPDPGLGARLALTSGITADLAANPDFSQIEADADRVVANTKYPLSYDEKRPFFLEGSDFFETPRSVLYSRSIADPLGGLKVSGRAGNVGLGVLSAWDEAPGPSTIWVDYASGELRPGWDQTAVAGSQALDSVARVRVDVGDGGGLGVIASDKELFRPDGSVLGNHVAGVDTRLRFGDHLVTEGQVLGSLTDLADGDTLAGAAWTASAGWNDEKWGWVLYHDASTPGFRAENGFLEEVGRMVFLGKGTRTIKTDGVVRTLSMGADAAAAIDFEGALTGLRVGPRADGLFGDHLYQEAELFVIHERFFTKDFDRWTFNGYTGINVSPHLGIGLSWDIGPEPHYRAESLDDLYLGWNQTIGTEVTVSAFDRLTASWDLDGAQFKRSFAGEVVYPTLINRLKVNVNLTRPLSVRWIEEWNTADASLDSSALLAYEVHPGTAAWLGYSQSFDLDAAEIVDQQVFAKVSYLWRV